MGKLSSLKSLSLRDKILAALAAALSLVIVAFLIYSFVALGIGLAPAKSAEPVDDTAYEFVFDGKITIYEEEYDVRLKGKDNKFTVDANKIKNVTGGTYTFTEGQGWTFSFDDANGTVVRTQYDKTAKTFGFVYALDMGSRGAGNLRLSYAVESFAAAAVPWNDVPSFAGTAGWFGGTLTAKTVLTCDAEDNFKIFCPGGEINVITGKYKSEGGNYVFTCEDGTVYTAVKNAAGLYAVTVDVYRPALAAYGAAEATVELTQVVLTVD